MLLGVSVGGTGVALGGTAVGSAGAAVEAAVASGGGAVIPWVAVGVQAGSSTVGVLVDVTATVSGGVSVSVGIEIIGVKTDTAATGVAVALSLRELITVKINKPATTMAAHAVTAASATSVFVRFLSCGLLPAVPERPDFCVFTDQPLL